MTAPKRARITGERLGCVLSAGGALVVLVLLAVSIGKSLVGASSESGVAPLSEFDSNAPADAVALLDGLRPGDAVGDFRVYRIAAKPAEHRLQVELHQGDSGFNVWVMKKGGPVPPRETGKYGLYYGGLWGAHAKEFRPGFEDAVLTDLTSRIGRTEDRVPPPQGL
ncbi:MAG: hypothetical protein OZ921_04685 [Sorangiineae bacterium]|nr:hypothetical protein [Polyangiaceae bacterium]MEB2321788.1 hypothetical protein [Sorangiineae bacterium]